MCDQIVKHKNGISSDLLAVNMKWLWPDKLQQIFGIVESEYMNSWSLSTLTVVTITNMRIGVWVHVCCKHLFTIMEDRRRKIMKKKQVLYWFQKQNHTTQKKGSHTYARHASPVKKFINKCSVL